MERLDHVVRSLCHHCKQFHVDIIIRLDQMSIFLFLFGPPQEVSRTRTQHCVTSMNSHVVRKFSGSVIFTTNQLMKMLMKILVFYEYCFSCFKDVDNIYHVQNCRVFNIIDFSHLDNRQAKHLFTGVLQFFKILSCDLQ